MCMHMLNIFICGKDNELFIVAGKAMGQNSVFNWVAEKVISRFCKSTMNV